MGSFELDMEREAQKRRLKGREGVLGVEVPFFFLFLLVCVKHEES